MSKFTVLAEFFASSSLVCAMSFFPAIVAPLAKFDTLPLSWR